MHEISLVRNIIKTLEAEFQEKELNQLLEIDLKVGPLSNVEPVLMQNAFEAVVQDEQRFTDVKLNVNVVPIKVKCELCGAVSEVHNYVFRCENGHPSSNVIQGDELVIEKVRFAD